MSTIAADPMAVATKILTQAVLERWREYDWTLQGFGMLRTYFAGKQLRLHVWDSRYRAQDVTMLHTHPWDFDSLVVTGTVSQYRYHELEHEGDYTDDRWVYPYVRGTILCGEGGGECAPPVDVYLERGPLEVYGEGEVYTQEANEIHESLPEDGTVTLINRTFHEDTERAFVYWPAGQTWVTAEPRAATPEEVEAIVTASLERWF